MLKLLELSPPELLTLSLQIGCACSLSVAVSYAYLVPWHDLKQETTQMSFPVDRCSLLKGLPRLCLHIVGSSL